MDSLGLDTYQDLIVYWMGNAREILTSINAEKTAMYWSNEDTFYQRYQDGDILVYWGESANIGVMLDTYPMQQYVMAPGDYFYMDCGFGNKYGGNSWCDPFKSWWTIYSFEPSDYTTSERMLGSQLNSFDELNKDDNIHVKTWPRGAALADKQWGPLGELNLAEVVQRQLKFASFLESKGIPTSPITGHWCELNADFCFAPSSPAADEL